MNAIKPPARYFDFRLVETGEKLSLDLARHLPRRLCAGPAVIIADKPAVLLPVLRKRWMRIIREVERQRSSTLVRERRQALEDELGRMRSFRFGTSASKHHLDALLIGASEVLPAVLECATLYITAELPASFLESLIQAAPDHTLFVVYTSNGTLPGFLAQNDADRIKLDTGTELLKNPVQ
jgi:hypothetical protein